MKFCFLLLFIFLAACNNLDIKFKDEQLAVFYVFAQSGRPAMVYIGESTYTDQVYFPETDTLQVDLKMYKNDEFSETLEHMTEMYYISNGDTIFDSQKAAYTSIQMLEPEEKYSFILNYKNYPELILSTEIPLPAQIDSFHTEPNIAIVYDEYYIQHNLEVFFIPQQGEHYHYFISVFFDYSDSINVNGDEIHDNFFWEVKYLREEQITRGETNSVNYTVLSKKKYGDFIPTIYLVTISDNYYYHIMNSLAYQEYKQSSAFFENIPARTPYSILPNAYANVFAYSVTKKTGELIQLSEPTIND